MRAPLFLVVIGVAALAGWFLVPHARPRWGPPIVVGPQRVTEEDLQRWLIQGPCRARLEARKTHHLIDRVLRREARQAAEQEIAARELRAPFESSGERDRALAAAQEAHLTRRLQACSVDGQELEREYARTIQEFLRVQPTQDLEAEISRTYRRSDWFRAELRTSLTFDRVFFPEPPEEWPEETWRALERERETVRDLRDLSRRTARDLLGGQGWRELREEDPDALARLRETVRRELLRELRFEATYDGLPPGLVFAIRSDEEGCSDLELRTAELWSEVEDSIEPWELAAARRWLATALAMRVQLGFEAPGSLDAHRQRVAGFLRDRAQRQGLDLEELATGIDGFPSPEAWVEYHTLLDLYGSSVGDPLAAGEATVRSRMLERRLERSNRVHGGARVDAEILLVAAADIPRNRWPEAGFERAHAEARALHGRIEDNERSWSTLPSGRRAREASEPLAFWNRMLDEESDWWDPPEPRVGETLRPNRNHGRYYGRTWNELRTLLSESDATDWATGVSITAHVFFEQEPGTISGPMRCALGWVLVRLCAREGPERALDPVDALDRKVLAEDELRERFVEHARRARQAFGVGDEPE